VSEAMKAIHADIAAAVERGDFIRLLAIIAVGVMGIVENTSPPAAPPSGGQEET
jgi:hypothetical protein